MRDEGIWICKKSTWLRLQACLSSAAERAALNWRLHKEICMPFIHIRSLPLALSSDMSAICAAIAADFAAAARPRPGQVHCTWQMLAGMAADRQQAGPVLVELVTARPDTDRPQGQHVHQLMTLCAQAVATHGGVPLDHVFVEHRYAGPSYIGGGVSG
jgi:hypothetical protein